MSGLDVRHIVRQAFVDEDSGARGRFRSSVI